MSVGSGAAAAASFSCLFFANSSSLCFLRIAALDIPFGMTSLAGVGVGSGSAATGVGVGSGSGSAAGVGVGDFSVNVDAFTNGTILKNEFLLTFL